MMKAKFDKAPPKLEKPGFNWYIIIEVVLSILLTFAAVGVIWFGFSLFYSTVIEETVFCDTGLEP
jgi:hypothetical protein